MKKALLCIGIALVISPIIYAHIRETHTRAALDKATHTVLSRKNNTL